MFLVIPLVEFLHVLGVAINVHHENPATFFVPCPSPLCIAAIVLPRLVGAWSSRLEPGRDAGHPSHLSTRLRRVRQPRRTPRSPAQRVVGWGKATPPAIRYCRDGPGRGQ